jgi:hypothetical protein
VKRLEDSPTATTSFQLRVSGAAESCLWFYSQKKGRGAGFIQSSEAEAGITLEISV